jgi:2,4-diketo-3-deoxy-L-fuconate hydrolase
MAMGVSVVRFQAHSGPAWGVVDGTHVLPLKKSPPTLALLLEEGVAGPKSPPVPLAELELLSPVTAPCQIICQGKNYADHALETGTRPEDRTFNIFFTKASSALAPGRGKLLRPEGVRLLDYEVELGIVIGRRVHGPVEVTPKNLPDYIGAFVLANDVSARDVQVPEGQWFRGKSFRGFCPVGPLLFIPTREECARLEELELELSVNDQPRQKGRVSSMIYKPAETLSQLSRGVDLERGDLLLTGTPGGVAMAGKPTGEYPSERAKNEAWISEQLKRPNYLKSGDRIQARIRTPDGAIDLGTQELVVGP